MLDILMATSNQHKIQELQNMLGDLAERVKIKSPLEYPEFPVLKEDGLSFEENSTMKAVQASAYADTCAVADDSGLEVEALNGAPGIYSARYAGENASDADRINKLLNELKDTKNRKARFVCVITIAYRGNKVKSFRGEVNGRIALQPSGNNGFGYDPVFIPDGYDSSFAELGSEIKGKISHRANAMKQAVDFIRAELDASDEVEFE